MTKTPIPLRVDDLTPFARALSRELGPARPSHLVLMNMLARAAGFQNLQHMRAASAARKRLEAPAEAVTCDARLVERTLHQFDASGRLRQWPARRAVQTLALWGIWATLPARAVLPERAINAHLAGEHLFRDNATLRRLMISCGLLTRNPDGTAYRRIEQPPPAEARAVMQALAARRAGRTQTDARETSSVGR